mmetsp:Transcript_94153/g.196482  ORF Transcript_94153/g.196482 Transcript_94153/m.196482 type:complete len:217 (+) Transcript_94153:708-1358(+)
MLNWASSGSNQVWDRVLPRFPGSRRPGEFLYAVVFDSQADTRHRSIVTIPFCTSSSQSRSLSLALSLSLSLYPLRTGSALLFFHPLFISLHLSLVRINHSPSRLRNSPEPASQSPFPSTIAIACAHPAIAYRRSHPPPEEQSIERSSALEFKPASHLFPLALAVLGLPCVRCCHSTLAASLRLSALFTPGPHSSRHPFTLPPCTPRPTDRVTPHPR